MVSNAWASWEQKRGNGYEHDNDQNGNDNNYDDDYDDDDDDDHYHDDIYDDDNDHDYDDDDDDAKHLCDKNNLIYGDGATKLGYTFQPTFTKVQTSKMTFKLTFSGLGKPPRPNPRILYLKISPLGPTIE